MSEVIITSDAPRPHIEVGNTPGALVPTSFDDFYRIANVISKSGLAPNSLNTAEAVMVAMMYGAEMRMTPMQSLQSIAVINGRPALYGDGLVTLARRAGCKIAQAFEGELPDKDARAIVTLTRPDGELVVGEFTYGEAVQAGLANKTGPWKQYPRRMMMMRARAWAIRDGASDLLGAVGPIVEELEDAPTLEYADPSKVAPKLRGKAAEERMALVLEAMAEAETQADLDVVWDEQGAPLADRLSRNAFAGLEEAYAQAEYALTQPKHTDLDANFARAMTDDEAAA